MPRLTAFDLKIKTGEQGRETPPQYSINGFALDFDDSKGGFGPGETLEVTGSPDSFPHSLVLRGPDEGVWKIDEITATYYPAGEDPYTLRFGAVELDAESDLDIWQPRPTLAFDV
jgi:hypothetical protein